MGRPIGPKKVQRYSREFKLTAVKLSRLAGVQVQTVAQALDVHPIMLSRWRTEVRDGLLRGRAPRITVKAPPARELKRLQALKREHAVLQEEHERSYLPYYNRVRLHPGLGYRFPVDYEARRA